MLSVSDNPGKSPFFYKIQRDDGTVAECGNNVLGPKKVFDFKKVFDLEKSFRLKKKFLTPK